jgi:hypothetical protein
VSSREEVWQTVSFSPLPQGWSNLFEDRSENCPGVLLQENRGWVDGPISLDYDPPFKTRVVFASYDDVGTLRSVTDYPGYIKTHGPKKT